MIAPLSIARDGRPVAAFFRSPLFNLSEGFVQAQAAGLRRYQPIVAGLFARGHVVPALADRLLLPDSAWELARFKLFGDARAMAARMRPLSPLLLHAQFGTDGVLALPLAAALDVPLVTTLRGYDISRAPARMLASHRLSWIRYALFRRRLADAGALFLAVSDALRRRAIAQGYPEARTLTHYDGVDLSRYRPEPQGGEPGLILHVGRLVEKKGTALLIEAFAAVKRAVPGAALAIIGAGPLEGRLRRQAAALSLDVRFLGALGAEETAAWMRRAWVLAAPSVTARDGDAEGLPTVIVEAAASALPAVGSIHAGIPEAIVEGATGFLVPEGAAEPLSARLIEILRTPSLRHSMALAGRRLAAEKFDAVRQAARLEAHYDRLTARASPAEKRPLRED